MTLNDFKEQLQQRFQQLGDRLQDSSLYNQIKDKYQNLNPRRQKLIIFLIVIIGLGIVIHFPYANWMESHENISQFERRRDLIRRLLTASREGREAPQIPRPPPADSLRSMVLGRIEGAHLLDEQLKSVESSSSESQIITDSLSAGGLVINLTKLNLRQLIDVSQSISSISPSVKMVKMKLQPNAEDSRYHDISLSMVALNVPEISPPPQAEEEPTPVVAPKKKKNLPKEED